MQNEKQNLTLGFFVILAVVAFFTPIFAIYDTDSLSFVIIVLVQWILSFKLWEQQFSNKKTVLLWILMSILLIVTVFLRDRVVFHFGFEGWYHSIKYYIYIGLASTFYWAMVEYVRLKENKERQK